MPTATARRPHVAVSDKIVSADKQEGAYFWYSIPKDSLALSRVRKAFRDCGLDVTVLPDERRGEHVAMEACRSVEGVHQNGTRIEIHSAQVMRDEHYMIFQITRHVTDKQNRVIEHPKALRVLYDFGKGTLSYESLGGVATSEVEELRSRIQDYFDKHGSRLTGHNFRTILRHYVEAAGAENMRGQSGGVYFLPERNPLGDRNRLREHHGPVILGHEFTAAIKTMLEQVYGRAPEFHRIPVIIDEEQREFLKRKFLENCSEDLREYRDELIDMVKTKGDRARGFRADKIASMIERRKEIDARRQKFASILGEELGELDQNMTLADGALAKFIKEADNG